MPMIHSNDSWTRLREVWLGDVYPAHFYDHLEPEVRDVFYQITEWTKEDLSVIERKLQEFGVVVRRPQYHAIENHMDREQQLTKPDITPRDHYIVIGNTLYIPRWRPQGPGDFRYPWQAVVDEYAQDPGSRVCYFGVNLHLSSANMVRVGRDLYLDCQSPTHDDDHRTKREIFDQEVVPMFPDHRVHYFDNGGHMDGCFAVLKPGYVLANRYFDDYERTFPGWEKIMLDRPEFWNHNPGHYDPEFRANHRWWLPDSVGNRAFNDHVIKYAQDWIGNYTETYFEVNCLVIDEKNVLMLGENQAVFDKLASIGITAHPMPFRCRTFWDGGIHCLTVDIRRDGACQDFFPERG